MTQRKNVLLLAIILLVSTTACQKANQNDLVNSSTLSATEKRGSENGKGKTNDPDPIPDPVPVEYAVTYQVSESVDSRGLYRFSISKDGTLMLLESDPTVAAWGSDFWGTWSSPFPYSNGQVVYVNGLSQITYTFTQVNSTTMHVTERIVTQPWPSGTPTTSNYDLGLFTL